MPISAVDAITPALHHTKQQLLHPFRIAQWAKLALVGFLAGEMTSGGCSGSNFNMPGRGASAHHGLGIGLPHLMVYAGLIAILVVAAIVLFVLFLYVSSVMRFVLFDSVIAKRCEIAKGWNQRQRPGMRYFVWQILFSFVSMAAVVMLIGIPSAIAFTAGWFTHPKDHVIPLVLGGLALFFVVLAWLLFSVVVQVLTKDFVVPQMALEDLGPVQSWRRLWPMIQSEKSSYAAYLGMKLVMNIGAAIVLAIASMIAVIALLIPFGGVGLIAVLIGKTAGLTWNVYTISSAVVAGCIFVAILLYVISLISVPAMVFFPSYAIYFFASRYPRLAEILYPPPAAAVTAPPFLPPPEPIA